MKKFNFNWYIDNRYQRPGLKKEKDTCTHGFGIIYLIRHLFQWSLIPSLIKRDASIKESYSMSAFLWTYEQETLLMIWPFGEIRFWRCMAIRESEQSYTKPIMHQWFDLLSTKAIHRMMICLISCAIVEDEWMILDYIYFGPIKIIDGSITCV